MNLAVIGIGAMGLPIALRLGGQGHAVTVRDIDPARERQAAAAGCAVAGSAAAAAEGADLVIVVVVDGTQTREVLFGDGGVVRAARLPPAVMLCPTISPADTEAAASALAAQGVDCVDAPMSGGPARARDGTMSLMVACDDRAFGRAKPALHTMSSHLFRVGRRPGDGARTKLVNNLLAAVNLAGAAEALALADRMGLDPAATLAVIEQSSGQSWIGSDRLRRALAADPAVRARVALLAKDSALALGSARAAGLEAPLGEAAAAIFARAVEAGWGDADDSALWHLAAQRVR